MKNTTNLARMSSKTLTNDQLEAVVAGLLQSFAWSGITATKPGDSTMWLADDVESWW